MISASNLWAIVIAAIGLILTIMNIVEKSLSFRDRAKKPDEEQNERIDALEKGQAAIIAKINEHDRYFAADKTRIENLEQGIKHSNTVIIRSLQSLISHSINGNSVDSLKRAKEELDEYLLDR